VTALLPSVAGVLLERARLEIHTDPASNISLTASETAYRHYLLRAENVTNARGNAISYCRVPACGRLLEKPVAVGARNACLGTIPSATAVTHCLTPSALIWISCHLWRGGPGAAHIRKRKKKNSGWLKKWKALWPASDICEETWKQRLAYLRRKYSLAMWRSMAASAVLWPAMTCERNN